MSDDLERAARRGGLKDLDLLPLARGQSDQEKVDDLHARYPAAFDDFQRRVDMEIRRSESEQAPPAPVLKHARDMSPAEFREAVRQLDTNRSGASRRAHIEAEMAKPSVRGLPKAEVEKRLREYLRGCI